MREPGFEPGSQRWQRRILTTILLSQKNKMGLSRFELETSGFPRLYRRWSYKTGALIVRIHLSAPD
jgi:hypothetical protein